MSLIPTDSELPTEEPPVRILGWSKTTLLDYPGRVASTLFLQGCNFRCPYCHNPELVLHEKGDGQAPVDPDEELALAEERDRLQAIIGSLGEGVCVLDRAGRVVLVNHEASRLTGTDPEAAVRAAGRCLQCKKPACVEGCPVGVDIPGFIGIRFEFDNLLFFSDKYFL